MKYYIITYGCQMNKSDSERLAMVMESKKYQSASSENEADLIVVNMCSVRQSAVNRVYGLTQRLAKLKAKNPKLKAVLTGCLLKKDKQKFKEKFDEIQDKKDLLNNGIPKQYHRLARSTVYYVPISSGCNNGCTYCVVPFTRGPLVCRDHQKILAEVKNATDKGFKEIWLLGQNVNDYNSRGINFAKLLKMTSEIPGDFKIRLMSPNPADFSDELIDVMADSMKIAKYLNLPLQSGDDKILKKMNRKYTVKQYMALVKKIRKKIPDLNLSTDAIVGFPGETKKQFGNTVKLFKETKFDMAYISRYSPRPGTAAFKLKDDVSPKEKKRRWKILNSLLY
ncbi:MAG: MiaB/RimO family radical SAM methylthiotransferase [bacterium]